jgi:hypothetical protein
MTNDERKFTMKKILFGLKKKEIIFSTIKTINQQSMFTTKL